MGTRRVIGVEIVPRPMKRRAALGLGAGSALAAGEAVPAFAAEPEKPARTAEEAAERIAATFAEHTAEAGGTWRARISVADGSGELVTAVEQDADAVNTAMRTMGFPDTQVGPGSKPSRIFLGKTTPREIHDLLLAHAGGSPVSEGSSKHMFALLRSPVAFTDGIRLLLSTEDRERVATKAGRLDDDRHEAGILFGESGEPVVVYSIFATLKGAESSDFGPRHPLVETRARMGHRIFGIAGGPRGRLSPATTISRGRLGPRRGRPCPPPHGFELFASGPPRRASPCPARGHRGGRQVRPRAPRTAAPARRTTGLGATSPPCV